MIKILAGTMLGISLSISGFYIAYKYLEGLDKGGNPLLLIFSVLLVGAGVYILMRTGKSNASVIKKVDNDKSKLIENRESGFASMLEKNEQLSEEWSKSVENRDRLKMLQMAGEIKEQTND